MTEKRFFTFGKFLDFFENDVLIFLSIHVSFKLQLVIGALVFVNYITTQFMFRILSCDGTFHAVKPLKW